MMIERRPAVVVTLQPSDHPYLNGPWVLDAKRIQDGPLERVALPHKISSGTDSCWAGRDMLGQTS